MTLITSVNPNTGEILKKFESYSKDQIDIALIKADSAFKSWKQLSVSQRCELLINFADLLRNKKQELAELITLEMGKINKQAIAEIVKCANTIDYFAIHSKEFMQVEYVQSTADKAMIYYEPMGVVFSIKPWNYPFWQVLSSASHILAGGNVILLKHSSYVSMCALKIEELFIEAGFPLGVFQTLIIDGNHASGLIANKIIKAVSFTGSEKTGRKIAEICAKNMKKFVLELGGSDSFIVFEDADIEKAVNTAISSRYMNAGQTCISAKRFIISQKIADEFINRFMILTKNIKIGDPSSPDTNIGPLIREQQIKILDKQVEDALSKGAKLILKGGKLIQNGFFYAPTIISDVTLDMKIMTEETFGPVVPFFIIKNEDEAIKISNASRYGLGASIWTKNIEKGEKIIKKLETGMAALNGFFSPEPALPFGGIKCSGIGVEMSKYGFYEFMYIKSLKIYS